MNEYHRLKTGFYSLLDIPANFQEQIDRTLKYQTPLWLDEMLFSSKRDKEMQRKTASDTRKTPRIWTLNRREKMRISSQRNSVAGTRNERVRRKPKKEKIETILHGKPPTSSFKRHQEKNLSRSYTIICKIYIWTFGKKLTEWDSYWKRKWNRNGPRKRRKTSMKKKKW